MTPKYQVFVSSTYEDLRAERDQVIRAVLEMGHIPVGMEMFSAADEEQWKIIKRHIDESDYYVVIVAHRYGSVVDGVSYTEKEYDYALSQGVPVIGFILDSSAPWPKDRVDTDQAKVVALEAFKQKLRRKPIGIWSSSQDLYGRVSIAFIKLITANPRPGWVRAVGIAGPEVMGELARLSSENARLRTAVDVAAQQASQDSAARYRDVLQTMSRIKLVPSVWFRGEQNWMSVEPTTLYRVFELLGPQLMAEESTKGAATLLSFTFASGKLLRPEWPMPWNLLNAWLTDLVALAVVEPSQRKHHVKDTEKYWTLTPFGREVYAWMRRLSLEHEARAEAEKESTPPVTAAPTTQHQIETAQPKKRVQSKRRAG